MIQNFPKKERACGLSNCPLLTLGELFIPQPDFLHPERGTGTKSWSLRAEAGDWAAEFGAG